MRKILNSLSIQCDVKGESSYKYIRVIDATIIDFTSIKEVADGRRGKRKKKGVGEGGEREREVGGEGGERGKSW